MYPVFHKFLRGLSAIVGNHHVVDSAFVALINFIVKIRGFVLLPLITKSLGLAEYGIWVQCIAVSTVLATFQGFNLHTFLVRTISQERESAGSLYASSVVLFCLPNILLAGIFGLVFKSTDPGQVLLQLQNTSPHLFLAVMAAPFMALFNLNMSFYRACQRIKFQQLLGLFATSIELVGVVIFIMRDGILEALYFILCWRVLISLSSLAAILITEANVRPSLSSMIRAFRFAWPLVFSSISLLAISRADRFLIGAMYGAATLGLYSVAANLAGLVSVLIAPFSVTLLPKMSSLWKVSKSEATLLVRQYRDVFLILVIPLVVLIGASGGRLIAVFSSVEASSIVTHGVLILVSLSQVLWGLCVFETFLLYGEHKTGRVSSIRILVAICNVIGNLIALYYLDYFVAGIVLFLSYFLMYVTHRRLALVHIPFQIRRLSLGIGISIAAGLVLYAADNFLQTDIAFIIAFGALYVLVLVVFYFAHVFDKILEGTP